MSEEVEMPEGRITEEALKEFGKRVGKKLRVRPYNEVATKDNIGKFADGIGDPNQLWRDEAYAKDTGYERIVAPPSWLFSVFPTWVLQGLPRVHAYACMQTTSQRSYIQTKCVRICTKRLFLGQCEVNGISNDMSFLW